MSRPYLPVATLAPVVTIITLVGTSALSSSSYTTTSSNEQMPYINTFIRYINHAGLSFVAELTEEGCGIRLSTTNYGVGVS
jgi:hypothetical protein